MPTLFLSMFTSGIFGVDIHVVQKDLSGDLHPSTRSFIRFRDFRRVDFPQPEGTDESGDLFFVNLNVYIFQRMEISVMEVHVFNRHLIHLIYPFVIFLAKKLETALIRSTMTSRITAVAKALSI